MKDLLERAMKDSAMSYRNLHIVLDAIPTPLSWASMSERRILFVNRAFRRTFGYHENDLTTIDGWIEKAYPQEDQREEVRLNWQRLWDAPKNGISEIQPTEVSVLCADGTLTTTQHRGILLHDIDIAIATFEDISSRKLAESMLQRIASEDVLTGLANRRALQNHWEREIAPRRGTAFMAALLLIDLDGFKAVNDLYGHDAGDAVLVAFAARLRESVRGGDLICRIGGDEFVVLLPDFQSPEQVEQLHGRLAAALARPMKVAGRLVEVGASMGAALFPQDADTFEGVLKHADEALYRVKTSKKGGWQWFNIPKAA